ncbi:hypothetical protein TcWFU_004461 [Taenia crassiceps]|uniref:Secreted protein n=1 Tax=Taenia crassiceps TaxID=6207 RepID=A0ABR4QKE9_9CEST
MYPRLAPQYCFLALSGSLSVLNGSLVQVDFLLISCLRVSSFVSRVTLSPPQWVMMGTYYNLIWILEKEKPLSKVRKFQPHLNATFSNDFH